MAYIPKQGDGIIIPYNDKGHLFCIMNDPCKDGLCLLVMLTSIKDGRYYDDACVLGFGDHDFLKHPTYALYRMAETALAAHIVKMVDSGYFRCHDRFKPEIFDRLKRGLFSSENTTRSVEKYANSVGI